MSEVSIIEKIKTYAKQKVIILSLSLLVSGVGILIACIFTLLEGSGILNTNVAYIARAGSSNLALPAQSLS